MSVMPLTACATQTIHENSDCGEISSYHHQHSSTHDAIFHHTGKQPHYDLTTLNKSIRPITTEHSQEPSDHGLTLGSTLMDDESMPLSTSSNQDVARLKNKTKDQDLTAPRLESSTSLDDNGRHTMGSSSALRSSGVTGSAAKIDLGQLDDEEEAVLEAEIAARRAARRSRRRHYADTDDEDDHVQIGTRVAEGHRNYQLMYDMLTGIRIAVGRVSAKMRRDPNQDDFTAAHKLVFDVTGNELTPGVKYDFKFKDYAPWVFRHLREIFHIDAADYLMSLTHKYILSELGSPGKSGSFFYYSRDYRFIIKTIHRSEHVFMRNILLDYYDHVRRNPNTLLCRIYGLHRIKLPRGRKIHFVVMGNVFPSNKNVHEIYDLKGSTYGRLTPEEEVDKNPDAVMKDLNWVHRGKQLELGPEKRRLLISQLENDIDVLTRLNIMDYSLLIGIHGIEKGNDERFRDQRLQLIETRRLDIEPSKQQKFKTVKYTAVPLVADSQLSKTPSQERRHCVFYADNGGFQSSDANDEDSHFLYYIGVIDILTPYNVVKKTEHIWKSVTQDKNMISSVPPKIYGQRFLDFMKNAIGDHHT